MEEVLRWLGAEDGAKGWEGAASLAEKKGQGGVQVEGWVGGVAVRDVQGREGREGEWLVGHAQVVTGE